jgi:hypothetical protein
MFPFLAVDQDESQMNYVTLDIFRILKSYNPKVTRGIAINVTNASGGLVVGALALLISHSLSLGKSKYMYAMMPILSACSSLLALYQYSQL